MNGRVGRTDGQVRVAATYARDSMIEIVSHTQHDVKRCHTAAGCKRWSAAGMLQAEQQFRHVIGYTDLAKLVIATERRHLNIDSPNNVQGPR